MWLCKSKKNKQASKTSHSTIPQQATILILCSREPACHQSNHHESLLMRCSQLTPIDILECVTIIAAVESCSFNSELDFAPSDTSFLLFSLLNKGLL